MSLDTQLVLWLLHPRTIPAPDHIGTALVRSLGDNPVAVWALDTSNDAWKQKLTTVIAVDGILEDVEREIRTGRNDLAQHLHEEPLVQVTVAWTGRHGLRASVFVLPELLVPRTIPTVPVGTVHAPTIVFPETSTLDQLALALVLGLAPSPTHKLNIDTSGVVATRQATVIYEDLPRMID